MAHRCLLRYYRDHHSDQCYTRVSGTSLRVYLQLLTHFLSSKAGYQFVIGRVVTGFGNGLNTATVPSWQAECSKARSRGLHICIEASMIAIGTTVAYWIVRVTVNAIVPPLISCSKGFRPRLLRQFDLLEGSYRPVSDIVD